MSIARSAGVLFGVSESSLTSIANNTPGTGTELDVLGDDTSAGTVSVFVVITGSGTTGTVDITLNARRLTGQNYQRQSPQWKIPPTSGTQMIPLGEFPAARFMQASLLNNNTGGSVSVAVLLTIVKVS